MAIRSKCKHKQFTINPMKRMRTLLLMNTDWIKHIMFLKSVASTLLLSCAFSLSALGQATVAAENILDPSDLAIAIKDTLKSGPNKLIAEDDNSNNELVKNVLDGDTASKHFNKGELAGFVVSPWLGGRRFI
jgi:hypothetical protein